MPHAGLVSAALWWWWPPCPPCPEEAGSTVTPAAVKVPAEKVPSAPTLVPTQMSRNDGEGSALSVKVVAEVTSTVKMSE